jgi:CBS domain containing-hemolysin-like protein
MIVFICALLLLAISLTCIVLRKSYNFVSAKELKRRAAHGDEQAKHLYRAVAYAGDLYLLLWTVTALSSAGGFVLLTSIAPNWLCFIAVVLLLWIFYEIVPATRLTAAGSRITVLLTPGVVWILNLLHPVLDKGAYHIQKRYVSDQHTGLYERADLMDLIERQLRQEDSRFSAEELMIAAQALSFNDYTVHDIVTPWSNVKTIIASDVVGPVVIDEAHRSGQPLIPVFDANEQQLVGMLRVQQLGIKTDGQVSDLMDQTVYYLHEDDSLTEALHAFYVTNQPLFVVLDSAGHNVGVITMAAMLQQLLGELPGASAESYSEYSEVRRRHNTDLETKLSGPENASITELEPLEFANLTEKTDSTDETVVE